MTINKEHLEKMDDLLAKGKTFADLAKTYTQYDYWEIYWQVNNHSFLGKKRTLSNRLKSLVSAGTKTERKKLAGEAQAILDELYAQLKSNSAKLIEIDRVLRKR